jgi:hypothetical protein
MSMPAMDHIFAGVKWKCTVCGADAGTCSCFIKCECGRSYRKGEECENVVWHIALQFAQEAAEKVVEDMAESYRLFQREHMAARLKRAVIRQTHPILIETFEGVEAAIKERQQTPGA